MTKFIDVSGDNKKEKKETVFMQKCSLETFSETQNNPNNYNEVYYLGEFFKIGSLFKAVDKEGDSHLFKGIKGDEF